MKSIIKFLFVVPLLTIPLGISQQAKAQSNGYIVKSATTANIAVAVSAAGTTQATATAITANTVVVTTVASGAGIEIAGFSQPQQLILNRGTNALLVYPPSGGQIEALGTNAPYSIASGAQALIVSTSGTQAYAFATAAGAATGLTTAGTNLATATALTANSNVVSTCTTGGVSLPTSMPVGTVVLVYNRCGSALTVYPDTASDSIESNAAGTAVSVSANSDNYFEKVSSTQWLQ